MVWMQLFLGSYLYSQSERIAASLPDFLSSIQLDYTSIDQLIGSDYSLITSIDTARSGWIEWTITSKELVAVSHLYDLTSTVRSYYFKPVEKYALSNGLIIHESSLEDVELATGNEHSYSANPIVFAGEVEYYFSPLKGTHRLNYIKVRNEKRANFDTNFALDTVRLQNYFKSLQEEFDQILIDPQSNLPTALVDVGLIDDAEDYYRAIHRKVGNGISQHQIEFNHLFLRAKVNLIVEEQGSQSVRYFSLSFGKEHVYEQALKIEDTTWRETNEIYVVGFWCSAGGSPPKKMLTLLDNVDSGHHEDFEKWIKSTNPEERLYGAIGLMMYRFKHKNDFDAALVNLASNILSENKDVYGCQGCYFGKYKQQEIIKLKDLYSIYSGYVQNGFIR